MSNLTRMITGKHTGQRLGLAWAILILALAGCVRLPVSTPASTAPPTPSAAPNPLDGTNWRLVRLEGQPVPEQYPIYLMFGAATLRGVMGCNNYSAHYALAGENLIRLDLLEVTVELCRDAALMRLESRYTTAWSANTIGRALRFEVREEGEVLEFFDPAGSKPAGKQPAGNSIFLFENALEK